MARRRVYELILGFTHDRDRNRTLWVTTEGFIRAVEPGGKAYLEVDLERPIRQAHWYKNDLLLRTDDSVELWTAGSGHRVLAEGLGPCPANEGLCLHPHRGYLYPANRRRIDYQHGDHSMIFSMDYEVSRLKICDRGEYLGLQTEAGVATFRVEDNESLGLMSDILGDWLLWDALLICQVDNPQGTGLMVVDLRESRLIQGGPSGYEAFEKFELSESKEWLLGYSPTQNLVVGWFMNEGYLPNPRWQMKVDGLIDGVTIKQDQVLVFQGDGKSLVLDNLGSVVKNLPLRFRGGRPKMLDGATLGSIDGDTLYRYSISNGESVAYS